MPTSISSRRVKSRGRSRTASSRTAPTASSRAWVCARWPARRPGSRIRTKSCCRRCSKRRTPRAPFRPRARAARCRPGMPRVAAASTCRSIRSTRSTTATRSSCSRRSIARRVHSTRASRRSWRVFRPRTIRCSSWRATARWRATCARWCDSTSASSSSTRVDASRATPAAAGALPTPNSWPRNAGATWCAKPCAPRRSISKPCPRRRAP